MNSIRLPSNPKHVGPFLRTIRVRLGITQDHLVAAGVGRQSTVSLFENGHTEPQLFTVLAYLSAIGCVLHITQATGEPFPDALPTATGALRNKVYVPRPRASRSPTPTSRRRKSRAVPPAPAGPRAYPTNTYGRCLGCFQMHPAGQEECA